MYIIEGFRCFSQTGTQARGTRVRHEIVEREELGAKAVPSEEGTSAGDAQSVHGEGTDGQG